MPLWFLIIIYILAAFALIQILILIVISFQGIRRYNWYTPCDLVARYGRGSWVVITGASSGQGKLFAEKFAALGFNLFLIGSPRTLNVIQQIKQKCPDVKTVFVERDFGKAFEPCFFEPIWNALSTAPISGNISILVNNVGQRTGWIPYHEMPADLIGSTIAAGTIVQARLTHYCIPLFLKRCYKSAIINMTAQCQHPNLLWGCGLSNEICVPYMSVYEAANAFGYYHGNSIEREYGDQIDVLNITPGAVLTENTRDCLKDVPFHIEANQFVDNVIGMLGRVRGTSCGHYGHAFSSYLVSLAPWMKRGVLERTGHSIATHYMSQHRDRHR